MSVVVVENFRRTKKRETLMAQEGLKLVMGKAIFPSMR